MKKPGRPKTEPTSVIAVPVNRIPAVEQALQKPVAQNQVPIVKIRVPRSRVDEIRGIIKNDTDS